VGDDEVIDKTNPQSILLMGHSMGSVTFAHGPTNDPNVQQRIILVAPALGLSINRQKCLHQGRFYG